MMNHFSWSTNWQCAPSPPPPPCLHHPCQVLRVALKDLESFWLQGGRRPFMTGQQLSVPDVLCVCEIEQLRRERAPLGMKGGWVGGWVGVQGLRVTVGARGLRVNTPTRGGGGGLYSCTSVYAGAVCYCHYCSSAAWLTCGSFLHQKGMCAL